MPFNIKQNDTGPPLQVILREPSDTPGVAGDPVPLGAGDAVRFHMISTVPGSAVKVDAPAVIVNPGSAPPDGRVDYNWAALDTDTVGLFEYEFEITFAAGEIRTVPNARNEQVVIRAEIA
jgi:hypothetical protein